MTAEERRKKILAELKKSNVAVSAAALAKKYGVSRQIVVGDIALLRARGEDIVATPRGYIISSEGEKEMDGGLIKTIACIHSGEQMQAELNICVDNGCSVLDVIVEHPLYGQLTGPLQIKSRYDVSQFVSKAKELDAHALSELTNGLHLHTLLCPDEAAYERVCETLEDEGILLKVQD
ncbi:MAG: transcription repressor NadR [Lachnospiraceae bacterium]|nr:transcription repressor NadR [Lachnospiraceae bacterium]